MIQRRSEDAWLTRSHILYCIAVCALHLVKPVIEEVEEMDEGSTLRSDSERTSSNKNKAVFNVKFLIC